MWWGLFPLHSTIPRQWNLSISIVGPKAALQLSWCEQCALIIFLHNPTYTHTHIHTYIHMDMCPYLQTHTYMQIEYLGWCLLQEWFLLWAHFGPALWFLHTNERFFCMAPNQFEPYTGCVGSKAKEFSTFWFCMTIILIVIPLDLKIHPPFEPAPVCWYSSKLPGGPHRALAHDLHGWYCQEIRAICRHTRVCLSLCVENFPLSKGLWATTIGENLVGSNFEPFPTHYFMWDASRTNLTPIRTVLTVGCNIKTFLPLILGCPYLDHLGSLAASYQPWPFPS